MTDPTATGLVQLAREYYPEGFPSGTDDHSQDLHPYQRTPQYARWQEAWGRAMAWPQWTALLREMRAVFGASTADCTQPWGTACRRCCVYFTHPLPDGTSLVTRVAAAASILVPLYVTYCTTAVVANRKQRDLTFSFEPPDEFRKDTSQLAALMERVLGYQAFDLRLANIPVPGVRVTYLDSSQGPTLLTALFDNHLDNLP
jgi:ribosome modulation factor